MHVEKYNRGVMGHMLGHYDRTHPGSKSQIDDTKTHLNYNLAAEEQPLPQLDFIHKRLSEVKVHKRKDVNVFCDWVITAPKELSEHEYDTFFHEAYSFMSQRYGKDNVISAYVHMDESQPHMHFAFVPVTTDKKKNIPKLCAKEVLTKTELRTIHKDMSQHMERVFGRDIGILNGATELGNIPVDILRSNTAKAKAFNDDLLKDKAEELERKQKSVIGKLTKTDTVTLTAKELEMTRSVLQQSTIIAENAGGIIAQAKAEREKAERERRRAEEMRRRTEEYRIEEQKKAESKTKELDDREHRIDEKERHAEKKMQIASEQLGSVSNQELAVRGRTRELDERQRDIERQEAEMKQRTDDPYGYYNTEIQKLQNELDFRVKDCKDKDIIIDRQSERIISLEEEKERRQKRHIEQLRKKEQEKQDAVDQAVSDTAVKYISEITKKDETINSLRSTIDGLKEKLKHAYLVVKKVCNAMVSLAYKIGEDSTFIARLEPMHRRLIDGICNYAAKEAEAENFRDYAKSIRETGGVDDKILLEMDHLGYHVVEQSHSSQSYDRER
ncbi:MAG: plasmid recombination protein [Oscillospiraceae bacterium]|nr:plasmid recombination protein [Oscillospiraceae bacterium]